VVCRPRIKIPAFVMMPIAHLVDCTYRLLGPYGMKVPQLTPSRIRLLTCTRSFNCSKAKDLLGYTPIVSLQVLSFFMTKINKLLPKNKNGKKKQKSSIYKDSPYGNIFLIVLNQLGFFRRELFS
jgi:hypothetical protein